MRLGIDIGGTFTDGVLVKDDTFYVFKVLSTPKNPEKAVFNLIEEMENRLGIKLPELDGIVHGSTVATNAVIERKGANVCLITTSGFRDILEIQRHEKSAVYNVFYTKPVPLVPRDRVIEIKERMGPDGSVIEGLNEMEVEEKIRKLLEHDHIESIAVCFLHSYKNPSHELEVRKILSRINAVPHSVLSSEILPEYREYERASTTVISAYLRPVVQDYVSNLNSHFQELGSKAAFQIMQANGGIMPWQTAKDASVNMIFSGPAAGVIGTLYVGKQAGFDKFISFDVGGTSTDISLISGDEFTISKENTIDGLPVNIPMIEIRTLGAGGGSIIWVDPGGALRVGPMSAGAEPGPICYQRGGKEPSLTDACVCANLIRPDHFFGGKMRLDSSAAKQTLENFARNLSMDYLELLQGVIRVTVSNIARELHLISVERGYDPREYTLAAFGGAGGLLAVYLAEELNIKNVIFPEHPGLLSALGLLVSDFKRDFVQTEITDTDRLSLSDFKEIFKRLERKAIDEMSSYHQSEIVFHHSVEMRYAGQAYSLSVPVDFNQLNSKGLEPIREHFHSLYRLQYGHFHPDKSVEFVNFNLSGIKKVALPRRRESISSGGILRDRERICFRGKSMDCDFYTRESLPCGQVLQGPAVIEEPTSTSFILPFWEGVVDRHRNIMVRKI